MSGSGLGDAASNETANGALEMPNSLSTYATPGEARTARKLIRAALFEGWQEEEEA